MCFEIQQKGRIHHFSCKAAVIFRDDKGRFVVVVVVVLMQEPGKKEERIASDPFGHLEAAGNV